MKREFKLITLFVFALAYITWGCSDQVAPVPEIAGNYEIVSVNGQPLPAVLNRSGGVTTTLVSGSLIADILGSYTTDDVEQNTSPSGTTVTFSESGGRYVSSGSGNYGLTDTHGNGIGLVFLVGDTLSGLLDGRHYTWVRPPQ
ncbi:MAG: hypothetical protein ACRENK_04545 [Gemmatimonadaceae bacterium]